MIGDAITYSLPASTMAAVDKAWKKKYCPLILPAPQKDINQKSTTALPLLKVSDLAVFSMDSEFEFGARILVGLKGKTALYTR